MAADDPTRLYVPLLNTGLQQKNNPLYQVIHDIIGHLSNISQAVTTNSGSGSSSTSSGSGTTGPQGIQGPQGIRGVSGIRGSDGLDGLDGLDSFISGPQGLQGIQGVPGFAIDGVDGLDGLDYLPTLSVNSGIDLSFTIAVPITGGTVVMNQGQQRIVINPAGTLLALTVTLPAGPSNGQIAGMSFTQAITGLTINAPGGATVVAPAVSAAIDSTFRFIYQASSTSWFPVS
jgi:hypothetical protein